MSMYTTTELVPAARHEPLQRSGSYRATKSSSMSAFTPRHLEYASLADANIHGRAVPLAPRARTYNEVSCAYLTMNMQIAKATPNFLEAIGIQSLASRKFIDIVSVPDRDKILRLENIFDRERRAKEPAYLPPIFLKFEEDRVIQAVDFGPEDLSPSTMNHQELLQYQSQDGSKKTIPTKFGLAKRDSTYFVVVSLESPLISPRSHQPQLSYFPSGQYQHDHYSRRGSQPSYDKPYQPQPQVPLLSPFGTGPAYGESRLEQLPVNTARRPSLHIGQIPADYGMMRSPLVSPTQISPMTTRGDDSHSNVQHLLSERDSRPPQLNILLPPIREAQDVISQRRDSRTGRLDIVGLIDNPAFSDKI